jgi:nitroreductase
VNEIRCRLPFRVEAPKTSLDSNAIKVAVTEHAVHPLIRERWSSRAFSARDITHEEMMTLFEAASWAPSAMNEQPWRYRYALRGTRAFDALFECLTGGNRAWAHGAAALVVCSGMKLLSRNNEPNHSWQHDVGLSNANLLTQATSMDIHGHLLGGFDPQKVNALLAIDTTKEEVTCLLALGFLGDPNGLTEPFHTREITPRVRRALSTTVTAL